MRCRTLCHAWQGRRWPGERISGVATKTEDVRTIVDSHQTSEGTAVDLALSRAAGRPARARSLKSTPALPSCSVDYPVTARRKSRLSGTGRKAPSLRTDLVVDALCPNH